MPDFKGLAHDAAATVREPMSRSEYSMMLGALIVLTVAWTFSKTQGQLDRGDAA